MAELKQKPTEFDRWSKLAQQDPESFESQRLAAIDELIEAAPLERQQQLRRLQWRIDQERRRSKNPLGACIRISHMMWESLLGEGGLMDNLGQEDNMRASGRVARPARRRAEVVSFSAARD